MDSDSIYLYTQKMFRVRGIDALAVTIRIHTNANPQIFFLLACATIDAKVMRVYFNRVNVSRRT